MSFMLFHIPTDRLAWFTFLLKGNYVAMNILLETYMQTFGNATGNGKNPLLNSFVRIEDNRTVISVVNIFVIPVPERQIRKKVCFKHES